MTLRPLIAAGLLMAGVAAQAPAAEWSGADIVFLGEIHDNPGHHARQAEIVRELNPRAVIYEMLTPEQAERITQGLVYDPVAMAEALEWEESGWPDFSMYHDIFIAASQAEHEGAGVPREAARAALERGVAAAFGTAEEAAAYGLDAPLPAAEQAAREAEQDAAHCGALPETALPGMVAVQRLRDAVIARAALEAFRRHGGPVAVITGSGHARTDRGAPAYIARVAPEVRVFALGQGEAGGGAPAGGFDRVETAAPVARGDPCDAFR
ncbi:ChaN family lipoprotein [Roseivivax sp. CAU 1761]